MHSRRISLLAAALFVSTVPVYAQSGVTDPVLRRMWTLGMDSSRTWDLAQVLFDSIGPRLTGTPNGTKASDWVMRTYRSWGIDARREQYGTWRGWVRGPSHVDLVKPFTRSLEAVMEGYSPGTGGKDVAATTIILPMVADSNEFVKWLPNAKGKFVLMSAAYPTCRPGYSPQRQQRSCGSTTGAGRWPTACSKRSCLVRTSSGITSTRCS